MRSRESPRRQRPAQQHSGGRCRRRAFLAGAVAWATGPFATARRVPAQEKPAARAPGSLFEPRVEQAIRRGLDFLVGRQNEEGCFGTRNYRRNVAVVSLAGMAFMANGSTPGRGRYGRAVSRCVHYVLAHARDSGFIFEPGSSSHGPMYGHGFATLFLAEAYGMWPDAELRKKLTRAVKLIVNTQNDQGGWRYQPEPREADISVTICQVMALRAARNAGIYVPNETIDRCIEYVKRCQNTDGGFAYMLPGGDSQFPRSAAGVVALFSAGIYEGDEVRRGLAYLLQHVPKSNALAVESHFFYGHYYAAQAMWLAGNPYWQRWYPAVRDMLLPLQNEDGSWFDQICPEYGTAMACLVLQMPNNYLPIFQR